MYGIRTDIAGQTPVRFGAMQDISIEFNGEIKELYSQSQFAIDAARGKVKIMGKAKMAQISAVTFNTLFFGSSISTGQTFSVYNEAATTPAALAATDVTSAAAASGSTIVFTAVPAGVAAGQLVQDATTTGVIPNGTVVVSKTATDVVLSNAVTGGGVLSGDTINFFSPVASANQANYTGDLGVYYANTGDLLTYTAGVPTVAGTYTEISGNYFFAVADVSQPILLNYLWTNASVGHTLNVGNPFMGTTPKFIGVFSDTYESQSIVVQLYACVATKLTMPTKIDDYMIPDIDFSAYQNAAGQTVSISVNT